MTRRNAGPYASDDPGELPGPSRVIVHPPAPAGGRRVRVDGEILGLAHHVVDVAEFLRRAGLEIDPADIAGSPWIDWRGVGPEHWGREPDD
ncbi:hypothetical protein GCM10010269_34000 [Streptomyces humidus]|uniref:Uncharacterized protein n=1 Tax=Streptomyces humidus TaxID=52259 RepID=A0A918FWZ8_9ACTN|nr:hypothetical protein [Streptomyces humidus]GGR92039.1 hypothetical protein GCM10010269_34000 [Streptomyces humidus]